MKLMMMKMKSVDCQHVDTVNLAELQHGCSLLEYRCYLNNTCIECSLLVVLYLVFDSDINV